MTQDNNSNAGTTNKDEITFGPVQYANYPSTYRLSNYVANDGIILEAEKLICQMRPFGQVYVIPFKKTNEDGQTYLMICLRRLYETTQYSPPTSYYNTEMDCLESPVHMKAKCVFVGKVCFDAQWIELCEKATTSGRAVLLNAMAVAVKENNILRGATGAEEVKSPYLPPFPHRSPFPMGDNFTTQPRPSWPGNNSTRQPMPRIVHPQFGEVRVNQQGQCFKVNEYGHLVEIDQPGVTQPPLAQPKKTAGKKVQAAVNKKYITVDTLTGSQSLRLSWLKEAGCILLAGKWIMFTSVSGGDMLRLGFEAEEGAHKAHAEILKILDELE